MLELAKTNPIRPFTRPLHRGTSAALGRSASLLTILLGGLLLIAAAPSAMARPGPGYGDLIDRYCIERGRLRVGAHQGHCAACHHQGTFDSAPEHRIEPNWTEFERGRDTGVFDFFCPPIRVPAAASPAPQPPVGRGAAIAPPSPPSPMGKPPAGPANPQSPQAQAPQPPGQPQTKAAPATPAATLEMTGRLASLHNTVRIQPPQEPAWREFVDAVAEAAQREPTVTTGAAMDRIKARERELSERIVAFRALNLALSRLAAQLDEAQRRSLSDGLTPLLDAIR